jgi:hypothetical protein
MLIQRVMIPVRRRQEMGRDRGRRYERAPRAAARGQHMGWGMRVVMKKETLRGGRSVVKLYFTKLLNINFRLRFSTKVVRTPPGNYHSGPLQRNTPR